MLNTSIRENILFGSVMDHERYVETVTACCLTQDFKSLKHGDLSTNITLSPSLLSRIALARAVYSRSDIVLLDNPFAVLDFAMR